MFCRKCGKEINNTSRFCPFCGTPVVMPAAPVPVTDPEPAAPASATVEAPAAAENRAACCCQRSARIGLCRKSS